MGMCSKQCASGMEETTDILHKLLHYPKSPIFGTQFFKMPKDSWRLIAKRLTEGKEEYDEMERRFPSVVKTVSSVSDSDKVKFHNYFRLYKIWKARNSTFSDEQSEARNVVAFEFYQTEKAEMQRAVQETWGYSLSQSVMNYLMFWQTTYQFGLREVIESCDEGFPMGMLAWVMFHRTQELAFRSMNGEKVDIKLQHRYNDVPELLTAISGAPGNCDRYQWLYDRPDMPTCIVHSHTGCSDNPYTRTLLECVASNILHELQADYYGDDEYGAEYGAEYGENEFDDEELNDEELFDEEDEDLALLNEMINDTDVGNLEGLEDLEDLADLEEDIEGDMGNIGGGGRVENAGASLSTSDEKLLRKKTRYWRMMYVVEQIMRFEKVLGFTTFCPEILTEKRERIFNFTARLGGYFKPATIQHFLDRCDVGICISDFTKEKVQEAIEITNRYLVEPKSPVADIMELKDIPYISLDEFPCLEFFKQCEEKGNYIPILRFAHEQFLRIIREKVHFPERPKSKNNYGEKPHATEEETIRYVCDAYNKIGAPTYGEIFKLVILSEKNPRVHDVNFGVYSSKINK
eukprot:Phypoly_transcript_06295.p1 GENE.Phypoly_transcript_06295~~Phypoly_transcript_06295.p1  ORF type:complete len:604 (+),score=80.28 Phypoly_transcript_06295:89-1813(+)